MSLRTSMIIDLAGNLSARAGQFLGSMQRLGTGGSRSMQVLNRSIQAAGRGLDRLGNRYTALLSGAAGVGAVRQVAALETRFMRLGIQADKSNEDIAGLKKQIYEAAKAPDIRVDPGEITSAIEDIVEKTGDLKFAQANIRNIGLAIQATGAQGQDIGQIMAEFQKMGIIDPKQVMEAMDTLNVQGKEGAFTLQNLAALGPRVVTAYTSMGRGGVGAIREMGAALQVIRMGTGSSEQAATAFEAVMRTLGDKDKVGKLQKGGIQVFDPDEAKKGKQVLRPINELMAEIVKKTGGKKTLLSEVFDAEAMRAFNAASAEYQRTGSVETLEKFMKVQGDGATTTRDSARAAGTFNAALTNLYTVWKQFADNQLSGPVKSLTSALNGLEPGTVERWLKVGTAVVGTVGALVLAKKGIEMFRFGRDLITGGKGARGGLPGLGGGGGPIPVYVVNQPGGTIGGNYDAYRTPDYSGRRGGGPIPRAGSRILQTLGRLPSFLKGGTLARLGGMGRIGAALAGTVGTAGAGVTAGSVLAAGAAGYGIGKLLNLGLGWATGKMSGGKYKGSGAIGEMLYDFIHKQSATQPKKQEVGGEIKIKIESETPARVTGMKAKNSKVPLNVDSGLMYTGF